MLRNLFSTAKWIFDNTKGFRLSIAVSTILISIVSLSNIAIAVISKKLVDAATSGDKNFIYCLLAAYIVFVLSEIFIGLVNGLVNIHIWQNASIRIRMRLYQKLVNSYWLHFNKLHSGDYVSRLTQDVASVTTGVVDEIPRIFSSIVKFIAAFCVLAYYQPMIAFFSFAFMPIAFFATRLYSKKLKETYKSIQEIDGNINGKLHEFLQNIQVVKVFNLEELSSKSMESEYIKRKGMVIKNSILSNTAGALNSIGLWGGYLIAYSMGVFGIYNNEISFGVLVVFLQLFNQIQGPLSGIAGSIPKMTMCLAAAERLIEIDQLKIDECITYDVTPSKISVQIEDLKFSYPMRENQLHDIIFYAEPGEIVLIMGESGSGKTTLARLILSLINPISGRVLFVDEFDNQYAANAGNRKWVSYVPQGNTLFSGTIASNIRYGNPRASDEEIVSALISAEAWSFVSELSEGMYTPVGENGIGISEGQAQRVAIARALIHPAPVVIFDEATSGLDVETERRVMDNIGTHFGNKTFVVITHREVAREYSDRIYHMTGGTLILEN